MIFVVPGPLVTWKRAASKGGQRFTPKAMRDYQARVRMAAFAAMPSGWPMDGRYSVHIHVAKKGVRFDIDNCVKVLLDALNGVLYSDDSQVETVKAWKMEVGTDGQCCVVEVLRYLPNDYPDVLRLADFDITLPPEAPTWQTKPKRPAKAKRTRRA